MIDSNVKYVEDDQIKMLDELTSLLEKQIALISRGDISGIEDKGQQADSLVKKIAQIKILECPEFKSRREQLQTLYIQLSLAISAQRAETGEQLSRIRKGKKFIGSYRKNISL